MISGSLSGGKSSSRQFVDSAQQPFLDFLRNSARSLAIQQQGSIGQLGDIANNLYGQGQDFLGSLQNNPYMQSLQGLSQTNPGLVSQQVDQVGADIGRNFREQILPGIQSTAIGLGAGGGSRQGVAEGIAARGATDAMTRAATELTAQDQLRAQQAAIAGGGLNAQAGLGGIQSLASMFNMGAQPFQSQWAPLMSMNQIVGSPTVLGKSSSWNAAISGSFGGMS